MNVGQVLLVKLEDMLSRGLGKGLATAADDEEAPELVLLPDGDEADEDESVDGASVIVSGGALSVGEGTELSSVVSVAVLVTRVVDGTLMVYVIGMPFGARFLRSLAACSCSETKVHRPPSNDGILVSTTRASSSSRKAAAPCAIAPVMNPAASSNPARQCIRGRWCDDLEACVGRKAGFAEETGAIFVGSCQ
jgi:hypothetical protein